MTIQSFEKLKVKIEKIEKVTSEPVQCIFYLSTPPSGFLPILENLGDSGLARLHKNTPSASKVIVEKPFGRDLHSARELNLMINRRFSESQVFASIIILAKKRCKAFWSNDLLTAYLSLFGTGIMYPAFKLLYPRSWG